MTRWLKVLIPFIFAVLVALFGWIFTMSNNAAANQEKIKKLDSCCEENRCAVQGFNRAIGGIDSTLRSIENINERIEKRLGTLEEMHMRKTTK